MAVIVVGVDGSAGARAALEFAGREAKLRSARLLLVTVWHWLTFSHVGIPGVPLDQAELARAAKLVLEGAVAEFDDRLVDLEVELAVEQGQPADVLVAKAKDADLLVVGSRGRGGFAGLMLGSVSAQCAHHAPCPVVIVPAPRDHG